MPAKRIITFFFVCCFLASSLLACDLFPGLLTTTPTTASEEDSLPLDTWIQQWPGIELRHELWISAANNRDNITIVRLDPTQVQISVGYQPEDPLYISDWAKQTNALALINGGYFDKHNYATGLLVSNGEVSGTSYSGYGGMLAVDIYDQVSLRALVQYPYDPSEQLKEATQSSPMLIIDGARSNFQANAATDRRSAIAIDSQGRLLMIVSPSLSFSLDEFTDLMLASELGIQMALNLDGGGSTGMYIQGDNERGADPWLTDSITEVPITILINART